MIIVIGIVVFIIIAASFLFAVILISIITMAYSGVPFVSTPKNKMKIIFDNFTLRSGDIFYDLGCGDGRFLIEASLRGAQANGFELSPLAYAKAAYNIFRMKSNAKIFFKNYFKVSIANADVVFCFLLNTAMPKLEKKLSGELKKGALFISYGFPLPTWEPTKVISAGQNNTTTNKIYYYQT